MSKLTDTGLLASDLYAVYRGVLCRAGREEGKFDLYAPYKPPPSWGGFEHWLGRRWLKSLPSQELDALFSARVHVEWHRGLWGLSYVSPEGVAGLSLHHGSAPAAVMRRYPGIDEQYSTYDALYAHAQLGETRVVDARSYHLDLESGEQVGVQDREDYNNWISDWGKSHKHFWPVHSDGPLVPRQPDELVPGIAPKMTEVGVLPSGLWAVHSGTLLRARGDSSQLVLTLDGAAPPASAGFTQEGDGWVKRAPLSELDALVHVDTYCEWNQALWTVHFRLDGGEVALTFVEGSAPKDEASRRPGKITRSPSNPEELIARALESEITLYAAYSCHYDLATGNRVGGARMPQPDQVARDWRAARGLPALGGPPVSTGLVSTQADALRIVAGRTGGRAPDAPGQWAADRFDGGWHVWYKVDASVPFGQRPFGAPWYVVTDDGRLFRSAGTFFPPQTGVAWLRKHVLGKALTGDEEQDVAQYGATALLLPYADAPRPSPDTSGDQALARAQAFSGALAKLPVVSGQVFRAFDSGAARLPYTTGVIVFENGFVSASRDIPSQGDTWFTIVSKSGRDLSVASRTPQEREVVFDRGSLFRVLGVDQDGELANITLMQVIPDEAIRHMSSQPTAEEIAALLESRAAFQRRRLVAPEQRSTLPLGRQDFPVGVAPNGQLNVFADTPLLFPTSPPSS